MGIFSKVLLLSATAQADPLWKMFTEFKTQYSISFEDMAEDMKRFNIFKENMVRAEALTKQSGDKTQFGPTKFAHLAPEEFKATYLGYKRTAKGEELKKKNKKKIFAPTRPKTKDWRGTKAVTDVKDQGQCGSCWAFSATQAVETAFWKATGKQKVLAPQQTTSCDNVDYGCQGGNTETAYDYMRQAGGVELERDYPYTSGTTERTGSCKAQPSKFKVKVGATTAIASGASDEDNLMAAIQESPVSICVDAEPWQWYRGGVIDASTCGTDLDHCVHLVGYKSNGDYWIVKNSWAEDWGEGGYIYVKQGQNACGVAEDATIVDASRELTGEKTISPTDAIALLEGIATGLGLTDVSGCASASEAFAGSLEAAFELIQKKDSADMIRGLEMLAVAVETQLPAAEKECGATEAQLQKLVASLEIFKDPKAFIYHVEQDLMINGADIYSKINSAVGHYNAGDLEAAGEDVGKALEEVLIGNPVAVQDLYV